MAIRNSDMTEDDRLLHVWLYADGGDGPSFQADVQHMLAAIAERQGVTLEPADTPHHSSEAERHFFASVRRPPRRLLAEAGIHRAQIVPHDSQIGRIFTSSVGVEFLTREDTPASGKPDAPVLKTYNYVQKRVTRHATQERLDLDAVLSGSA